MGLLYLLTEFVGLFYLISAAISIESSILSNFTLNDYIIHFFDNHGHGLIIGFSDEVDGEAIFTYEDGSRILVVKNAQLNQWSEHTIDLPAYWKKANWWQPEEIKVYLAISTYYAEPGYYTLYIAKIEMDEAKTGTSTQ